MFLDFVTIHKFHCQQGAIFKEKYLSRERLEMFLFTADKNYSKQQYYFEGLISTMTKNHVRSNFSSTDL